MAKKTLLTRLLEDPFAVYDQMSLKLGRIDFNLLKEDVKLRRVILHISIALFVVWMVMGFDSGTGQIEWPIIYVFGNLFLKGKTYGPMTFDGVITVEGASYWYHWAYGKFMHFSAFVIYGFAFYFLSTYLSKQLHIRGSQNVIYSFAATLLSISVFEYFWMGSYYIFQNQPWILTWKWPQLRILLQNLGFILCGALLLVHVQLETFLKVRINWRTAALVGLTLTSICWWWFYPFPIHTVTVPTTTGLWTNTPNFPQTTYTVDLDPLDDVNAGEQFYLEDNVVHFVNTVAKAVMAAAFCYVCMFVPKRGEEWRRPP